jgi:Domain of unknown function (DUF4124)
MKWLNAVVMIMAAFGVAGFTVSNANGDIYAWTDENGVKYFTNQAPPAQATLFMKTPEIPYDEEADNQRSEMDRLEVARQELAEREAFLREQQQEAERRLAEANARADAVLREADQVLQDVQASGEEESGYDGPIVYGYGYGGSRYLYEGYYRNYGLYYKNKHYLKFKSPRPKPHPHVDGQGNSKSLSRPSYYSRSHQKLGPSPRARYLRSSGLSHRARTAAFRGRFGLY